MLLINITKSWIPYFSIDPDVHDVAGPCGDDSAVPLSMTELISIPEAAVKIEFL